MADDQALARILKIHKRWADGLTIIWQIVALLLFGGVYVMSDRLQIGPGNRDPMLIMLAALILIAAVWQGFGLCVARIHMLLEGMNLDRQKSRLDRS